MGTFGIVIGSSYIASLILAFILGGPPAEIVIAIPGIFYLAYRWVK
jgi:hypothetical protein